MSKWWQEMHVDPNAAMILSTHKLKSSDPLIHRYFSKFDGWYGWRGEMKLQVGDELQSPQGVTYKVIGKVGGKSAAGVVYSVVNLKTKTKRALKTVTEGPFLNSLATDDNNFPNDIGFSTLQQNEGLLRFSSEATIALRAGGLQNPKISPGLENAWLMDLGHVKVGIMVMELVEGSLDLWNVLMGSVDQESDAQHLLCNAVKALDHLHKDLKVFHGDSHAGNFLVRHLT